MGGPSCNRTQTQLKGGGQRVSWERYYTKKGKKELVKALGWYFCGVVLFWQGKLAKTVEGVQGAAWGGEILERKVFEKI